MQTMKPIHLSEIQFDAAVDQGLTLVDFYADWCGPCRMQAPVLNAFAEQYAGRVKVAKVDVDEAPGLARRFGIGGIPTMLLIRDGREVARLVGVQTSDQLATAVDSHLH